MIGLSLVATGLAMAGAQAFVTGRLSRRIGELRAAIVGLAVAELAAFAYAFVTHS